MLANDEDPDAAEALGEMYFHGDAPAGVERNLPQARHYFGQAAAGGVPQGHANLAMMYINGLGGEDEPEEEKVANEDVVDQEHTKTAAYNVTGALHHYQIAAEHGDGAALNGLGYIYLLGEGKFAWEFLDHFFKIISSVLRRNTRE